MRKLGLALALSGFSGSTALAVPLEGTKTVRLHPAEGEPIPVAEVTFFLKSDETYSLRYDDTLFTDHFLSMRPVTEGDLEEADTDSY